jgi:acetyltransferase-like isoleucine patch superfamily enzyme
MKASNKATITEKQGGRVKVGEGTYINKATLYASSDDIIIGKFCRISYEVLMITNYGSHLLLGEDLKRRCGKIIVGDNVFIGWRSMIRGGVTIGDFAIIGMGAVVTKDVEPFHMVVGNPAKDIGLRPDTENIIKLIKKRCGNTDGTPYEVLTKFKKQGYTFAEASLNPDSGALFYIAKKGEELEYTDKFIVK